MWFNITATNIIESSLDDSVDLPCIPIVDVSTQQMVQFTYIPPIEPFTTVWEEAVDVPPRQSDVLGRLFGPFLRGGTCKADQACVFRARVGNDAYKPFIQHEKTHSIDPKAHHNDIVMSIDPFMPSLSKRKLKHFDKLPIIHERCILKGSNEPPIVGQIVYQHDYENYTRYFLMHELRMVDDLLTWNTFSRASIS
jgi:hypothetical protein